MSLRCDSGLQLHDARLSIPRSWWKFLSKLFSQNLRKQSDSASLVKTSQIFNFGWFNFDCSLLFFCFHLKSLFTQIIVNKQFCFTTFSFHFPTVQFVFVSFCGESVKRKSNDSKWFFIVVGWMALCCSGFVRAIGFKMLSTWVVVCLWFTIPVQTANYSSSKQTLYSVRNRCFTLVFWRMRG